MKQAKGGSVLLINLFFLTIFSLYLGVIFRQTCYLQDQLDVLYRHNQTRYMVETCAWFGVAVCSEQFDTVQALCASHGVCVIPTEKLREVYQRISKTERDIAVSISLASPNSLQITAVYSEEKKTTRAGCLYKQIVDLEGLKTYEISDWAVITDSVK